MQLLQNRRFELDSAFRAHYNSTPSFQQLMDIEGQVYKQSDHRKTMRFEADGAGYFIKIHDGVGWREIFKNLINGRLPVIGAQNEYDAIHKLRTLNIDTLHLVGFGRRGINPARLQSFVITKELGNHISLENLCQNWTNTPPSLSLKRQLIRQVAVIARRLHENGINHRDLYLCHFLLNRQYSDGSSPALHLIDLHRVQIRSSTPYRWRRKDLAALYFSSIDIGLSQNDLMRFIREYSAEKSLRTSLAEHRHLWKQVKHKANLLYQKHHKNR